jgi:hypothetical protein
MAPGDGQQHEQGEDAQNSQERAAAVNAAERLLAGPDLLISRSVLLEMTALLHQAARLLERTLDEASSTQQPTRDDDATRKELDEN